MLAALLLACCAQDALPKIATSDASALAKLVAAALADPSGKSTKKAVSAAKALQSKYELASLIEALRAGPDYEAGDPKPRGKGKSAEKLERFGSVLYGFTFTVDDRTYRYGVAIPPKYDARKPAPLLLDPGHGSGAKEDARGKAGFLAFFRGQADAGGLEDALIARTEIVEQIGADGLAGARPDDEVAAVFDAFFRDLCSRFDVDLDRVWVSGLSQTGFWSWQLGNERADRFAGIAPMSAVSVQQTRYLANFTNVAIYILHGDQDAVCPIAQPRATRDLLKQLGVRFEYREIAGAGHTVDVWGHLHEALEWLTARPRDPYPKKIAKALQTTRVPWCYWVRVDELSKTGPGQAGAAPTAVVTAEVNGQAITIASEGVKALTMCLSSELVDLSKPVTITWNGVKKHDGLVGRDFGTAVELAIEKVDWRGTFEAVVELR
jgi:predicted esterase